MKTIVLASVFASLCLPPTAFASSEKISSELSAVLEARESNAGAPAGAFARYEPGGRVQVYIHVSPLNAVEREELQDLVAVMERERGGIVQAWVDPTAVDDIADLPFVRKVSLPIYGVSRAGGTMTQGDAIHRSDLVRSRGHDGAGVKVGVISNGMDGLGQAQVSGDLADVNLVELPGIGAEGTAMMEIIHDIAPAASLGFCGPSTSLEFIDCVEALATTFGADVIVDDLGFYGEPVFEDGPVALAVQRAMEDFGVLYVTSAGNDAERHYQADFHPKDLLPLKNLEHDFGAAAGGISDATLNVIVPPRTTMAAVLEWNDPFGASDNNYDLYVMSEDEKTVLASSKNVQNGNDDPVETVFIQNNSDTPGRAKLAVNKVAGANRRIKIQCAGAERLEEYATPQGSIFGQAAVFGVLAVGAVSAFDTGYDTLQPYSSRGPVEIFFPAYESRPKPDVVAVDTVSVSGAGGFPDVFTGTSAAAPHVAGMAALLEPLFPFAPELKDRLKATALDRGEPGFDTLFGFGFVDAFDASGLPVPPDFVDDVLPVPEPETIPAPVATPPAEEEKGSETIPVPDEVPEDDTANAPSSSGGCSLVIQESAPQNGPQNVVFQIWKTLAATPAEARKSIVSPLLKANYDFPAFYQIALQDHWQRLSDAERESFSSRFETVFLRNLSDKMGKLPALGGELTAEETHIDGNQAQVRFFGKKGQKSAHFRIFFTEHGGGWKICDVEVEGILLSRNYRAQFNRIIRNENFDGLLARLDQKNKERMGVQ